MRNFVRDEHVHCDGYSPTETGVLIAGAKGRTSVRRVAPVRKPVAARAQEKEATTFDENWLRKDATVFGAGFLGWTLPSNIPVGALGGKSLFALLIDRIGANLAKFPTGPSLDDPFWLYLLTWHIGLFACLFFGQIGFQARKQGYFD